GGGKLRAAMPGLRRALTERRPQVLISAEAAPNLIAIAATRLLPCPMRPWLVLREAGSPSIAVRLDPYRQNRIAYRILRLAYRLADLVVTLTDGALDDLAQNFAVPRDKLAKLSANAVIDADIALAAETAREPGLIVSVGRLSPEKDHATLIRAFAKLGNESSRLEIPGDGPMRR